MVTIPQSSSLPPILVLAATLLSACATPPPQPAATYERINQELARAASERKARDESIDKALMPPLAIQLPPAVSAEPRFDLSVVDAPAVQVFMALVTGTRYSMLLPPDLGGKITVTLKDATVMEALDTIRELYGYEYKVQGTRIFIQANTLQSRVFRINYLSSRRQGSSDLRVTSSAINAGAPGQPTTAAGFATPAPASPPAGGSGNGRATETSRVSMNSDADFWRDLSAALQAIVGSDEGRQVIVNAMSGVVVVRALPSELRNVESYIKATQLVVERQVMLEAKIIEVTLSRDAQSGINWSAFRSGSNSFSQAGIVAPGTTLNAAQGGSPRSLSANSGSEIITPGQGGSVIASALGQGFVGLAFQTSNFAALLSFLESQGEVSVLSSPRIATLNNQKALLKVGTDELFITNVSGGTTATTTIPGTAPSLTLQPYFSGISLDVTPQIDDEGNIILHVHPAISTVTDSPKTVDLGEQGIFRLPLASSTINETDSIVRVQDGNIVAIGGLMRQRQERNRSQLPGADNVPLVGGLLGQRANSYSKSEMVILIKPTIIGSDRAWKEDLSEVQGRMQDMNPRQFDRAPSLRP